MRWACNLAERHSARLTCGRYSRRYPMPNASNGMTHSTQAVTHDPGAAPSAGNARVPAPSPGHGTPQDGDDAGEQVRHADQVTEDEVTVGRTEAAARSEEHTSELQSRLH